MSAMKDKQITWDDWHDKFRPISNPLTDGQVEFDPHTEQDMEAVKAANPNNVWTTVEGDESIVVVPGYHYVNRLFYHITELPWDDEELEIID